MQDISKTNLRKARIVCTAVGDNPAGHARIISVSASAGKSTSLVDELPALYVSLSTSFGLMRPFTPVSCCKCRSECNDDAFDASLRK